MAAKVEVRPGPGGTKDFVFISRDGGHGDLIGGEVDFDDFLRQAMGVATAERTYLGQQLDRESDVVVSTRQITRKPERLSA